MKQLGREALMKLGTVKRNGAAGSPLWRKAVFFALLAIVASSCSSSSGGSTGSSTTSGGVLRLGTPATIASMNPFITSNTLAFDTFEEIYPYLVQYNLTTDQIEPDFATSWKESKNGLTWTFQTRAGATWSDGKPLTTADVAWTLNTIVKFEKGPTAGDAANVLDLVSATATSPTAIKLQYSHPIANVLSSLAQVPILPQHVWAPYAGGNGSRIRKFNNLPTSSAPLVSGGPFVMTKYTQNQIALFKTNPHWYGPKPKIAGFGYEYFANSDAEVEALKSGQIDAALGNPALPGTAVGSLKSAGFNIINVHATGFHDIIINTSPQAVSHRELANPKVREAFEYATDRNTINKVAYLGYAQPGGSIVPPASGSWSDPAVKGLPYDIAKGNQLLNEAGYKMGSGGIRVANGQPMSYKMLISTDNGGEGIRAGQIMTNDYKKIGVKLNVQVVNDTTLNNALYGNHYRNFQLAMWGWDAFIDPNYILSVVTCAQLGNLSDSGYCNPAYDALFKKQAATTNVAARQKIVYKMQQMIFDARPYIILEYVNVLEAWSKKWCGIVTSPDGFATFFSKDPMEQVHKCST
jgi:peptide/nickel transport system substrate-binding protein